MLKNGVYEAIFTAGQTVVGVGAGLHHNGSFVGVDPIHFFRGRLEEAGGEMHATMELQRHNHAAESVLGDEPLFTLEWRGRPLGNTTFRLTAVHAPSGISLSVAGRLLREI